MNSLLSSPITAIKAPVGTLFNSFVLSSTSYSPDGPVVFPLPSETEPSPTILIRWPFRTTQPEFVQPLDELSARTLTLTSTGLPPVCRTGSITTAGACSLAGALLAVDVFSVSVVTTLGGFFGGV